MINDQQKITFSVNCASYKVLFLLLSPVNVCPYYSCLSLLFKFFFPSQAILSYSCHPFLLQYSLSISYSPYLQFLLFCPILLWSCPALLFCPPSFLFLYSCPSVLFPSFCSIPALFLFL